MSQGRWKIIGKFQKFLFIVIATFGSFPSGRSVYEMYTLYGKRVLKKESRCGSDLEADN